MIGVNKLLPRSPDLVVSGINIGDNNTYQDVLASGTVAAALEAAITGIPAIAFSMEVGDESMFALEYDQPNFKKAGGSSGGDNQGCAGARDASGSGDPERQLPSKGRTSDPRSVLTEMGRRKYTDKVLVRKDPQGARVLLALRREALPASRRTQTCCSGDGQGCSPLRRSPSRCRGR